MGVVIHPDRVPQPHTPLVFLDIDGVLNSDLTLDGVKPEKCGWPLEWCVGIDPALAQELQALLDATKAAVVISSSWRLAHGMEQTEETLYRAGLRATVVGGTPNMGNRRGDEIQGFMDAWRSSALPPLGPFVILDDAAPDSMGHLEHHLVQTDPTTGLTRQDVEKAVRVLGATAT